MSGFLLDTNVVSESTKPRPHEAIAGLLDANDDLWLSVVVIHELRYGVAILQASRHREALEAWLSGLLTSFADRIIPVDLRAAELAASLRVEARRHGRGLPVPDALLAGTAVANGMTLLTRNIRHFDGLGVEVANPWEPPITTV